MKISELKASLRLHPERGIRFVLPDGVSIPAEFHVTEVGHVTRKFIDCGGTVRAHESCLLQMWISEEDRNHRLAAGKLAKILDLSEAVVPHDELQVEVEYGSGPVSHYAVDRVELDSNELRFSLENKQTDCLARERCGVSEESAGCGCGSAEGKCC